MIHTIPGTHASIGRVPHVKVLAAKLNACLEQSVCELATIDI
jgi:hypothetical protein